MVSKAKYPRVTKDWRRLLALIPDYDCFATAEEGQWFDAKSATKAIEFIEELLTHVEGVLAGKPFLLEDWQKGFVGCLYGWQKLDHLGRQIRRYSEALLYVPRKNGKTPLAAAICNFELFCGGEKGAQIVSAAADVEQAALLYNHAQGQVRNEPELMNRAKIFAGRGQRAIVYEALGSSYKVISSDANTKHGGNLTLFIIDELHTQKNRELADVLETSTASENRLQTLALNITTADYHRESICNEKLDYAHKVCSGAIQASEFLPVVYEATIEDDWTDPAVWRKANPNLGVSVSLAYMERKCKKAQHIRSFENTFKRLHLNIQTQQENRWLNVEQWNASAGSACENDLLGRECYGGLDLSSTKDLTSLALVFPNDDGSYELLIYFWCPKENMYLRQKTDAVPYETWSNQGLISATPGTRVDYDFVRKDINELYEKFNIIDIGFDRWNSTQIANQLVGDGIEVIQFGQGYRSLSPPSKEFERLISNGQFHHGNNLVLNWMVSNVAIVSDSADNIKPCKDASTGRIDGIVACVMAIGRATAQEAEKESIYATRGLLTV